MSIKTLASSRAALIAGAVLALGALAVPASAFADSTSSNFDSFTLGSVNGQNGWSATGPYDQAVVDTTDFGSPNGFGSQSLRVSDAETSGSFGDWVFAAPVTDAVGEASSTDGSFSAGTLQNMFDMQFDIAAASSTPQPGLELSVAPDRGDGSRMSYLRFEDSASGINVFFYDVEGTTNPANFVQTQVATNLDRTVPHHIELTLETLDGPSNDIVKVYIDGTLVHTGTSWENYYRYDSEASAEQSPRIVKTMIIQARGTANPVDAGYGFLFDNVNLTSSTVTPPDTSTVVVNAAWAGDSVGTTEDGTYVYGVNAFSTLEDGVTAVSSGGTVDMLSDLTTTAETTISKPLTINGMGHTLFAEVNNSANDNSNNAGLGFVAIAGNDTVNDLTVDGAGSTKMHGINIFDAGNVALNNVTVENNSKSGITDNGANVTVSNVTTKDNAWGGINADLESDAHNTATVLTITGTSAHTETGPDIWRDDNSKPVTVNVNGQYTAQTYTHDDDIVGTIWNLTPGCNFAFNPSTVGSGATSTLSWSCVGVNSPVTITDSNGATMATSSVGSEVVGIGTSGDYTYTLDTTENDASSTPVHETATLTVTSSSGGGGGGSGGGSGGSGGSGGGSISPIIPPTTPPANTTTTTTTTTTTNPGQVLGAETFIFTKNLWYHMKDNSDVAELQSFLVAEGYSIPDAVTQFFGPETLAATKAFQKANGIPQTGFVGPLTRAVLNRGIISTTVETTH